MKIQDVRQFAVGCGCVMIVIFGCTSPLGSEVTFDTSDSDTGSEETADTSDSNAESIPEPFEHRPHANTCDDIRDVPEPEIGETDDSTECTSHSDCIDGFNGRCISIWDYISGEDIRVFRCSYDECFLDSDCADFVCECGGNDPNYCFREGNCKVDSDCGANGYCSPSADTCNWGTVGYYCKTVKDECSRDRDCDSKNCMYSREESCWICGSAGFCMDG